MRDGSLRAGDINAFLDISAHTTASVPLASTTAACGFPSPADDYMDRPLGFNELLVKNPAATFAARISVRKTTAKAEIVLTIARLLSSGSSNL